MTGHTLEITATWIADIGVNQELRAAISDGLSGVRLILKGNHQKTRSQIESFCREVRQVNPDFKIIVDLPGSKPRLGNLSKPRFINHGQPLILLYDAKHGSEDAIPTEYLHRYRSSINVGERILVNDGKTTFEVVQTHKDYLKVVLADKNAIILPYRSLNLPDSNVDFEAFTPHDVESLHIIKGLDIDMVAVSMVNDALEISRARETLISLGLQAELIAKIETPKALLNLDEIAGNSDSLMIARGDLTTLCGETNLFFAQESTIKAARKFNMSIICATGLMTTLAKNEEPSISELCDASYLMQQGICRFLIADAELSIQCPTKACRWLNHLYNTYREKTYDIRNN